MPSISSTYLIPAIFLNPAFILHLINTFVSHVVPHPPTISHSPHPFMESIGPVPGSTLYMDMHADDQLCWAYTAFMVLVQLVFFGKVSENRGQRKARKTAKVEKERLRKERVENERLQTMAKTNGHASGMDGASDYPERLANGNGHANGGHKVETMTQSEASMTETSEEEMIV